MKLVDRRAERGMLDRLVEAVCAGQSRVLVLCGEPGVGKTALRPPPTAGHKSWLTLRI
jgi:predicted ATPase